ncbi:gliding motility lipoprotein GldB [Capnocytophaga sp.]|uniref:gliding motility lipoprotein GldB n=1 Tax=Capnocytophaga sp. TaxID=44737 RepID=UPI0026DC6FBF|nr:gliding motility lipoprotein GldB [Capnocytophaga sp.]MDO5104845.1 gliding motility lipoprotein GldB [Capnocytophaga sp.]
MKRLFLCVGLLAFIGCQDKKEKEIASISVPFETVRFDSLFFETPADKLPELRKEFPFFFTSNIDDKEWIDIQKDTLRQELYQEVRKHIGNFASEKKEIKNLFQHIKYYFPNFKAPKVITLTSEVDYQSRVIYADSLLLIGIDNYLGENHYFYENIQKYIRFELKKEYIVIDLAEAFAEKLIPRYQYLTFLDNIIYEGKKLYLIERLLPKKSQADILKYETLKWKWATENESQIWRYFIENDLLYQTDKRLLNRFVYPAPFSKFYLELDNESPGGVGRFVGLQIVQSFMEKNSQTSLIEMLAMKSDELFKKSSYKPKK